MVSPGSQRTRLLDRYDLLEPLGRGGMGVVWLAHDITLQRKVAIKEVHVPADIDPPEAEAMRARVMREARAAARLNHANVTTIYDVASDGNRTWIVMEYVDAPTLTEVVSREGPLPPARAAEIGLAILAALEAAHAQGIVHRDVKPGNVMVPAAGNVKLADFGVAAVQGDPKITMTGLIVGSPSYMSPEQASEGTVTEATDMWGLGATLYYAVEGTPAFDRGAAIPTLAAVANEPPRQAERAGALEPLLGQLLDKDQARRPQAADVRSTLQRIAGDTAAPAPTMQVTREAEYDDEPADEGWYDDEEPRRSAWPLLLVAVALLALALFALPRFLSAGDDPEEPQTAQNDGEVRSNRQQNNKAAKDKAASEPAAQGEEPAEQGEEPAKQDEEPAPADWVPFSIGSTGSTVAHPQDWRVQQDGESSADIVDPAGGRYLRVQYTDTPKDDAVEDWQQQSESFGASHDGYEEVAIEPYDYPGADTAALWEYTYTEGGAQLHAYNLAIVTGGRGYALNFQTREDQWASSQDLWDGFVSSFEPSQ